SPGQPGARCGAAPRSNCSPAERRAKTAATIRSGRSKPTPPMGTRSRKRAIVAAALGVAVLGIAWPVVGAAASRHPLVAGAVPVTETFTDATGDSGDGPDVTTAVLSTDSTGKLAVTVSVPNRPSLTTEDAVQLFL